MHPPSLDLNLLVVFEAIYDTKSTTLAAARLGLTQSAVSNALGRLRAALDDPLFVRTPEGMLPTARAAALRDPLRAALDRIRGTLESEPAFEPARARRRFRLMMTDVGQMVLLPRLLEAVRREAPGVALETVAAMGTRAREAAMEAGDVELAVGYFEDFQGSYRCQTLFREDYVCLVRADHPTVGDALSFERYASLPHAVYRPAGGGHALQERAIDGAFATRGLVRDVALVAAHFTGFARVIAATDLVTTLPRRLAAELCTLVAARTLPAPLAIPAFEVAQFWHARVHRDPGTRWLRRRVARLYATAAADATR